MKRIKYIDEFKFDHNFESLLELARINDKKEFNYDVFVYGGDSYGTGRNEHGEPHFHFSDNLKDPQLFKVSVLIPTETEWKQNKEVYICESYSDNYTWKGLRKEKKELLKWMEESNIDMNTMTNIEMIRLQWNILNKDNKNVKQLIISNKQK